MGISSSTLIVILVLFWFHLPYLYFWGFLLPHWYLFCFYFILHTYIFVCFFLYTSTCYLFLPLYFYLLFVSSSILLLVICFFLYTSTCYLFLPLYFYLLCVSSSKLILVFLSSSIPILFFLHPYWFLFLYKRSSLSHQILLHIFIIVWHSSQIVWKIW